MAKHSNRLEIWAAGVFLLLAGGLALVVGLPTYMKATATVLHPEPQRAPSVTQIAPASEWSESVDRARGIMRAGLAAQNLPGLSVAVGIGGDIAWAEGFGWADLEARVPMTPETRLKIGTGSMALASAAVGVLLEKGRLGLDDEIQVHVPEFPAKRWPVTLRQLMGHTAGVRSDSGDEGILFSERCERPVEALRHFADDELLFEPGTQYRNSKYGWILVSAAVEAAAGQPFLAFMRDQIFQPLGMNDTAAESSKEENPDDIGGPGEDAPFLTLFDHLILQPLGITQPRPPAVLTSGLATSYFPRFAADPRDGLHLMRPHNLSCYAGSMAFFSTPSDLVRFGLAIDSGTLLQPTTLRLLQAPQQLPSGRETDYGLGWELEAVTLAGAPAQAIGHAGESLGGRVASLMTFPDRGIVVAVVSNISYADTSGLALKVADAFAERSDQRRVTNPPASQFSGTLVQRAVPGATSKAPQSPGAASPNPR